MSSKVALLIGGAFLLLNLVRKGESCMCMPSHPQEAICEENSFIALVKVRNEAFVRVDEKLSREKKSAGEPASIYMVDKPKKFETNEVIDEDEYMETAIKPTASPNEKIVPEFLPEGGKYKNADFLRYRIKLYKAYKGIDRKISSKQNMFIYTNIDEGLCGKKLRLKQTYLIIGRIIEGRLSFSLCDHVIAWHTLSKNERRNIRKNMENSDQACKAGCEVKTCPWSRCKAENRYQCAWTSKMEKKHGSKFHPANFMCQPSAKGRCLWNISDVKKSSNKRRRRHNTAEAAKRHHQQLLLRDGLP